jgi:hypothetical protein
VKIDLSQVGARIFISIIQNQVVMSCKLFIFRHQIILVLRSTGWNELIEHPKDCGKVDLNSMMNSFQPGDNNVEENLTKDLKSIFLNKINTKMKIIIQNILRLFLE